MAYHDREWGAPTHHDWKLFEMLCLEGAQAGLSWLTILKKRRNYRRAFDRFDAKTIARYDRRKIAVLLKDAGIVRNRMKIEAFITNANWWGASGTDKCGESGGHHGGHGDREEVDHGGHREPS